MAKILIGIVGFGVIVFLALAVEYSVFKDVHVNAIKRATGQKVEEKSADKVTESKKEGCKSNKNPVFKAEFTDRTKILYIKPLGDTQSSSTTRSTIVIKEGAEVPVYSPTEATLEAISQKDGKYSLSLQISCEVNILFDRLDKVSEGISPETLVKAGQLLGYVKGGAQGSSFDFLLSNSSKQVSRINSRRWQGGDSLYADCPYEYFDNRNANNLRRDYIAYTLVHNDNIIQKKWNKEQGYSNIPCGDISHDIKGTASGGWFKVDSADIKGDYLSINKYLSTVQVSIRKDGKLVESLTDYSPEVLLPDVTPGKTACYQDAKKNKWIIVKLMSENKLSLAKGNGDCPTSFAQEVSDIWER